MCNTWFVSASSCLERCTLMGNLAVSASHWEMDSQSGFNRTGYRGAPLRGWGRGTPNTGGLCAWESLGHATSSRRTFRGSVNVLYIHFCYGSYCPREKRQSSLYSGWSRGNRVFHYKPCETNDEDDGFQICIRYEKSRRVQTHIHKERAP